MLKGLKSLSGLWLRKLVRATKTQQNQATKLLKGLLLGKPLQPVTSKKTTRIRTAIKPKAKGKPQAASQAKPQAKPHTPSQTISSPQTKPRTVRRHGTTLVRSRPPGKLRDTKNAANPTTNLSPALPGKWLASYYSSLADGGMLPAKRMRYYLYLPDQFPTQLTAAQQQEDKTWPLIVMLHGCEQTATQFAQGSRMNQLAEKKAYAVLYPQQSLRVHPNRCWKWYDKATQHGGGDVSMIVGMIEKVAKKYPIDRTRIYICGISAGAAMANIVALNHPRLIAAVGLHSAPVFGAGHGMIGAFGVMQHGAHQRFASAIAEVLHKSPDFPSMPTLLIHGQDDKIIRPVNQAQLQQQALLLNRMGPECGTPVTTKAAGRAGARNPAKAYQVQDFYLRKKLLLRVTQISHLAHAWSGGDGTLAFNSAAGPDASSMMLDFFARHRRINTPLHAFDIGAPLRQPAMALS